MGIALAFCLAAIALVWMQTATVKAAPPGIKGVICHATGSAGNPFVGIEVGVKDDGSGQLENNGHVDENGSPLSGHEEDQFLGYTPEVHKRDCDKLPPPPDPK